MGTGTGACTWTCTEAWGAATEDAAELVTALDAELAAAGATGAVGTRRAFTFTGRADVRDTERDRDTDFDFALLQAWASLLTVKTNKARDRIARKRMPFSFP